MFDYSDEKREDVRITLGIETRCQLVMLDNQKLNNNQSIPVVVENLSCGGVMLRIKKDFPEGSEFFLELDFIDEISIIARCIRKHTAFGQYYYGCKFLKPSMRDSQIIRKFIFQEMSKRKRGH